MSTPSNSLAGFDRSPRPCPSSSGASNGSDGKCPLFTVVLRYGNWSSLKINPFSEKEPVWLHNNPILLRSAVRDNNLEGVCSLLYTGTNVNGTNELGIGALEYAIKYNYVEIVRVMINFYDDLYFKKKYMDGCSVWTKFCLFCRNSILFKLLFQRMDPKDPKQIQILLKHFLSKRSKKWDRSEWLECLYLIVRNLDKSELIMYYNPHNHSFFSYLFRLLSGLHLKRIERIKITYICLSIGIPISFCDCDYVYHYYGFEGELEALIYGSNLSDFKQRSGHISSPFLPLVVTTYKYNFASVISLQFPRSESQSVWNRFIICLGFYALSVQRKMYIKAYCRKNSVFEEILRKLDWIPEFPTLFELCRDQVRKMIHESVKYPYQFHDAVKGLELPDSVCDMIRLKRPIYY